MRLAGRPMSTPAAIHDDQVWATANVPDRLTLQDLKDRLDRLAASDATLRMSVQFVRGEPVFDRKVTPNDSRAPAR